MIEQPDGSMAALPVSVLVMYAALVVWIGLLVDGYRRRHYTNFLRFGVAFAIVLNARYFVSGTPEAIAFFVGFYDVLHNAGVHNISEAAALAPCYAGDKCSVWADHVYPYHPTWGVAFYRRFVTAQQPRTLWLYTHVFFNTLAFVLMMVQLHRTGMNPLYKRQHRVLGYLTLVSLLLGVSSALSLASEHGSESHYGGSKSTWGFCFMALCVVTCAAMGFITIRRKDIEAHRKWMVRFAGSMWGSFWLFRSMEFVLGPLLRHYNTLSILLCVWSSAPLGIAIAEYIQTHAVWQQEKKVQ